MNLRENMIRSILESFRRFHASHRVLVIRVHVLVEVNNFLLSNEGPSEPIHHAVRCQNSLQLTLSEAVVKQCVNCHVMTCHFSAKLKSLSMNFRFRSRGKRVSETSNVQANWDDRQHCADWRTRSNCLLLPVMHSHQTMRRLLRSHRHNMLANRRKRETNHDQEDEIHRRIEVAGFGRRHRDRQGALKVPLSV